MPVRRPVIALVSALALVSPASALAQSAGDDQYQDPLAGQDDSGSGSGSSGSSATPAPTAAPTTAPSTSSGSGSTSSTTAPSVPSPSASSEPGDTKQLPYTGFGAGPVGGLGGLLLAGGVLLRVRLRRTER